MSDSRYDDSVLKTMISFVKKNKNNDNNKKLSLNQQVDQLNNMRKTYKQLLLLDNSPNINGVFIMPQFNKIKATLQKVVANLGKNEPNDVLLLLLDSMSADKDGKIVVSYKNKGDHKKLYDALRTFEYHFGSIFGTYFLGFDKKGQTGGAPYHFYDNRIRIPPNIIDNVLALIPYDHNNPYWVEMIRNIIDTHSFDPDLHSGILPHIYLIFTMAEIDPTLYRLPQLSDLDHREYMVLYHAYTQPATASASSAANTPSYHASAAPHQYGQQAAYHASAAQHQYAQPYGAAQHQYAQPYGAAPHQYAQPYGAAPHQYAQPYGAAPHQYAQPPAQSASAASSSAASAASSSAANTPRTADPYAAAERVVRNRHEALLGKIITSSGLLMDPEVAIETFSNIRMEQIRDAYEELLKKKHIKLSSNNTQSTMFLIDLAVARMTSSSNKAEVEDAKRFLEEISAKIKEEQRTWRDKLPHWSTVAGTAVGASEAGAICAMAYGAVRYCNNSRLLWIASGFDTEFAQIATGAICLATVPLLTRAWQHGSAAAGFFRHEANQSNKEKAVKFIFMRDQLETALIDSARTVVKAGIKAGATTVAGSIALLCGVSPVVVAGLVLPDGATAARSMLDHAAAATTAAASAAESAAAATSERMRMARQEAAYAQQAHRAHQQAQAHRQRQHSLPPLILHGIIPGEPSASSSSSSSGNASTFPSGSPPPPPPPPPPSGSSLARQPSFASHILNAAASSMVQRPQNQGPPQGGKRHHKRTRKHRTRKANKKYPTRRR